MPRTVSMRASYGPDAAYLLRLQAAVRKDNRRSRTWVQKVLRNLNQVSTLFLQAESEELDKPVVEGRRRPRPADKSASDVA